MSSSEEIFKKAIAVGEKEMASLQAKDVDAAGTLARERKGLMEQLFAMRSADNALRSKLVQLQVQQGKLTLEARTLQTLLKQEIMRVRGQSKRFSGYRSATSVIPISSRFVNKRG